jgi:hypothetical protein
LSVFFYQFVNGLTERYPELFDADGYSSRHQANFGKKWGPYSTLVTLAQENITRFDEIVELPLEKCLLYLAFQSDKNQLEELMHKEALKKSGT